MGKAKKPTTGGGIPPARKAVPALAARGRTLVPEQDGTLVIRWSKFDFDGPWCLSQSDGATLLDLMRHLGSLETMRPNEIFGTGKATRGTDYEVSALPCEEARQRLAHRGLADETRISALRITGQRRFWGIRRGSEFYALFWDPGHVIWPAKLKHT